MARNRPNNAHGNDTLPLKHQRRTFETGGSSFGQLSCGRRILASKYQLVVGLLFSLHLYGVKTTHRTEQRST